MSLLAQCSKQMTTSLPLHLRQLTSCALCCLYIMSIQELQLLGMMLLIVIALGNIRTIITPDRFCSVKIRTVIASDSYRS
jgi:hypothetical protein